MTHKGYIPQFFVPVPDVDGWMDGDWKDHDERASTDAAIDILHEELDRRHPNMSFVTDRGALQPNYQGLTWVGGDVESEIEALTGAGAGDAFDDAYEATMERYEEWLVVKENTL